MTDLITPLFIDVCVVVTAAFLTSLSIGRDGRPAAIAASRAVFAGLTAIMLMQFPAALQPGFRFDLRTVPVAIVALTHGPAWAVLAALLPAGYRWALGGAGVAPALIGFAVIAVGGGLIARPLRRVAGWAVWAPAATLAASHGALLFTPGGLALFPRVVPFLLGAQLLAYWLAVGVLNTRARLLAANAELRSAREAAERLAADATAADRAKSAFLANVSHELRTPLASIIGFSELLAERVAGPLTPRQEGYVRHVRDGGEHLLALVNDVLDVTRIEAGRLELAPRRLDLRALLEECVSLVSVQAERGELRLSLHVDAGADAVHADPVRLRQAVTNLLSNAVKFTPPGGRVTVAARRDDDVVLVVVRDTGIGISADALESLFRPFSQVDGDATRRHGGTGLGLAITRRLVELHGGSVIVESAPGEGSTFTLRLPSPAAERVTVERSTAGGV